MSYQLITLTSDESLSWAYPFTGGIVVADYNDVMADGDYILTLPPASNQGLGATVFLNNVGNKAVTIAEFGSIEPVITLAAGQIYTLYTTDNSSAAGSWTPIPFGNGVSNITNFTAKSSDGSVIIDNGTISAPGGTIDFKISESLTNLNELTSITTPGYLVISDNTPLQYVTRSFIGGTNISITYPDGVASGTVINLQSTLTNLTSVTTSDSANNSSVITPTQIIITDSTTGNICNITSAGINTASGLGALNLNGVNIDKSSNVTSVNSLTTANLIVTNSISSIPVLNVGNLLLNDSTITTKNANSDLILSANGLGALILNNVNIDSSANISNINTLNSSEIISPNIITEAINAPTNILTINNIQIDSSKNINDVNKLTAISVNVVTLQVTDNIISPNIVTTNINSGANAALTINGVNIDITGNVTSVNSLTAIDSNVNTLQVTGTLTGGNIITKILTSPDIITDSINSSMTELVINGINIDTSRNIENVNTLIATSVNTTTLTTENLNISGNINTPRIAAAWCCFTDTGQGCTSSIVLQDSYNVTEVTGAAGVYTINFTDPLISSTYAVVTSLQRQGSTLTPFQSFVRDKSTSSLVVVCTDTLGNLLPPFDGLSVVIFSNN